MNCLCTFWNKINSYTGWINFVFYSKVCLHMYGVLYSYFVNISKQLSISLHHAVLLICYWCNMESVGLAWMVRWEKFTHKTYDLKVLWNNQWYWMKYGCIWVMFICMIVHQGRTPCMSISMFFFAFMKLIPLTNKFLSCCWSQCLLWKNTNLEEQ